LTGQNMILQTTGANASGIAVTRPLASSTPDLELSGQTIIKTTGAGADGIQIGGPSLAGYAKINGDLAIEVTGSGTASGGCDVGAGICVTGESSQFEALGAGIRTITSSANALRLANGNNLTLALENANLTTTAGLALIEGSQAVGTSHLDLSNSVAQAGSSNQLINITNNSRIALNSDKTQLIGDTLVDASSLLNLNLRNTSYLLGRIQGPTNLNLDSTSAWDVTANSVVGDISNAGKITFKHTETGPEGIFKSITANNYVGNDGWLNLSTHLGDESSPSDKLIIDGGAATGTTTLNVTKYSGLGKPTRDKGIQVVEAKDGATTELTAFTLNGNVVPGGAYDYQLERNADASWYLVSREDLSDPESDDNLRPELSLYGGANALALLANANVIDTLHERKGGAQGWRGADPKAGPFWARVIRNEGQNRAKSSEDISGDDYDFDSTAIMAGMDVWSHQVAENIRSDAGVYVAYVDSKSHSTHYDGRQAGHNNLESTIVGAYWSNYFTNGMYVDVVGQYGYHRLKADSMRMLHLKTTGQSFALSVEVGMPFDISDAWIVEPQIQVRAQHGHLNNTDDSAGRVDFGAGKFLEGRLGVRAAYRTPETTFWTRFDVLREFQGESTTTVTAMSGKYAEETPSSLKGNSIALTLGVEKYLTKNTYMYASGDYKKRIGNEGSGHSYGLNLGVKFTW
jgi:outer membrane autotransporter protein